MSTLFSIYYSQVVVKLKKKNNQVYNTDKRLLIIFISMHESIYQNLICACSISDISIEANLFFGQFSTEVIPECI